MYSQTGTGQRAGDSGDTDAVRAARPRVRRSVFLFGAVILIAAGAAVLSSPRPHRPAVRTVASPDTTVPDSNGSASSAIPSPDTSAMQPDVAAKITQTREAVVAQPLSADTWGTYGTVLDVHEIYGEAVRCYQRARELAPTDSRWAYLLAVASEFAWSDVDRTAALFQEAVDLEPDYAPLWFRFGEILEKQGSLEQARAAFERALTLNDDLAVAHYALGQNLLKLGHVFPALPHLQRAYQLAPTDGPALAALAQAYMHSGDPERASQAAERARSLTPTMKFDDPIYTLVSSQGVSSRVCFSKVSDLLSTDRPTDAQRAMPYLRILERAQPEDPYVPLWFAMAHLRTGRPNLCKKYLDQAEALRANLIANWEEPDAVPIARDQLELAFVEANREYLEFATADATAAQLTEVLERFQVIFARSRPIPPTHLSWGNAELKLGRPEKALEHYRLALEIDPNYVKAHYNTGIVLQDLGRFSEAIDAYTRAAELNPGGASTARLKFLNKHETSK